MNKPTHRVGLLIILSTLSLQTMADEVSAIEPGRYPLHDAARRGDLQRVKALIKAGEDVEATDRVGWQPIHVAADCGAKEVVEYLCMHGARVSAQVGDTGYQPIHFAAWNSHTDVVVFLLEHGADINARTTRGWQPIHFAAGQGRKESVEYLIAIGADINAKDKKGERPLDYAVLLGKNELEAYLKSQGAVSGKGFGHIEL